MNEDEAVAALASVSSTTRLRILKCLVAVGPGGLTAGEIASTVKASPSRTSFHLSNMSKAGLVRSNRQSRQISYRVDFDTVGRLMRYLLHDCCRNNGIVRACCITDDRC